MMDRLENFWSIHYCFEMPDLKNEQRVGYPGLIIVGADEVGRGCLAGPVVAGAVALPDEICFKKDPWLKEVDDSKKLSSDLRETLAPLIMKWAKSAAIGVASVEEIDQINILRASHLAMIRAIDALEVHPDHILIDGKFLPKEKLKAPATAIVKGDHHCLSIAAASIIAKVWRDRLMNELDLQYPNYGFAKHKGYPTPFHTQALKQNGLTTIHRRSFKTCAVLA